MLQEALSFSNPVPHIYLPLKQIALPSKRGTQGRLHTLGTISRRSKNTQVKEPQLSPKNNPWFKNHPDNIYGTLVNFHLSFKKHEVHRGAKGP